MNTFEVRLSKSVHYYHHFYNSLHRDNKDTEFDCGHSELLHTLLPLDVARQRFAQPTVCFKQPFNLLVGLFFLYALIFLGLSRKIS